MITVPYQQQKRSNLNLQFSEASGQAHTCQWWNKENENSKVSSEGLFSHLLFNLGTASFPVFKNNIQFSFVWCVCYILNNHHRKLVCLCVGLSRQWEIQHNTCNCVAWGIFPRDLYQMQLRPWLRVEKKKLRMSQHTAKLVFIKKSKVQVQRDRLEVWALRKRSQAGCNGSHLLNPSF